jgi:hypothetical protein
VVRLEECFNVFGPNLKKEIKWTFCVPSMIMSKNSILSHNAEMFGIFYQLQRAAVFGENKNID